MNKLEIAREKGRNKWIEILDQAADSEETRLIVETLNEKKNIHNAAKTLGVDPAYLKKRMNELAVKTFYKAERRS